MNESTHVKILNYFENLINNNKYIYITEYIDNLVNGLHYSMILDLLLEINSIYNIYITKIRNKHRERLNTLIFNDYINLINKILHKINYYKYLFNNHSKRFNDILLESYTVLFNNIIIDPIIFTYIYNKLLISLDQNGIQQIYDIVINIQNVNNISDNLCLHLMNATKKLNMTNIYTILNDLTVPLPVELNSLNKLNIILKDINTIFKLFNFLSRINKNYIDIKNIINNNIELLLINIYDLICIEDIDINNYIIINLNEELKKLNIYYNENDKNINLIQNKIIIFTNTFTDEEYNKKLLILYKSNILFHSYLQFESKILYNFSLYAKQQDNLINYLDKLINNNNITDIILIIKLLNKIKKYDYDTFIFKYADKLTNRLISYLTLSLHNFNDKIKNETKIYYVLNDQIKDKICLKIKKLINDIIFSYHLNDKINNKTKALITSYNTWDINLSEGMINTEILYNSTILDTLIKYDSEYKSKNNNKQILWFPIYGKVKCEYLKQTFIMLPIQYMILETFEIETIHDISKIYNLNILKNYSLKVKENLINTLILSKILFQENNKLILSTDTTIKYNNNLILLYLNNNNNKTLSTQIETTLTLSRMEVINTNINSLLKIKPLSKEELFKCLENKIKLFIMTPELYDKSLEFMIKNDYINIIDNNYFKIIY